MADGDYYARKLAPGWRKVGNAIRGGQPLDLVAGLATKAFAETMRLSNGVPGLSALAGALVGAAQEGDRQRWVTAAHDACRASQHHANTQIAVLEGQRLLENQAERLRGMSAPGLARELAEATATHIAAHHLDRCVGPELPDHCDSVSALRAFERDVRAAMPLEKLAAETLRHEDGVGYVTPRRETPAAGTAGLIDRPLPLEAP